MIAPLGRLVAGAAIAVLLAIVPAGAQSFPGAWSAKAPLPAAHSEVALAVAGGKLYVVGGTNATTFVLTLNEEYDPATGRWRERAPLPQPLTHLGIAGMGGKVYVVGGFSDPTRDHVGAVETVYVYDPAGDTWRTLAPLERPRGSVGVAVLDGKLHAIGGRGLDLQTVATHEVYDPTANRWTEAAPLPRARDHLAVVALDGKIHAIGGRFGSSRDNTDLHDVFDPRTNAWQSAAPLPTARSSVAATVYHGLILVVGGECNGGVTFDQNEAFDPRTGGWQRLAPNPARPARLRGRYDRQRRVLRRRRNRLRRQRHHRRGPRLPPPLIRVIPSLSRDS